MQIPQEFYIYIIPGLLYILCLISFLGIDKQNLEKSIKNHAVIALPTIIMIALILGYLMQTNINLIVQLINNCTHTDYFSTSPLIFDKEKLTQQNLELLKEKDDIYGKIVFIRGIFIPLICLSFANIKHLFKNNIKVWRKIILVMIIIITIVSLINQWYNSRNNFIKIQKELDSSINYYDK